MSGTPRRLSAPDPEEFPADEEYARTYAAGYEEGLRSALKELLAHASRGHTNQELRALIQSRLARVAEEVELKRRSMLSPPRPRPWDSLARPAASGAPVELASPERVAASGSLLVCEERPRRALEVLRASAERFPRVVVVSPGPVDTGVPEGERLVLVNVRTAGTASSTHLTPGEVLGRLKEPTEADGGALVYVDALEFFVTEEGLELTLRFAQRLVDQVQRTRSAVVVSFDQRSLEPKDASRLERAFGQVLHAAARPGRPGGA